jgi:hypothetical protein
MKSTHLFVILLLFCVVATSSHIQAKTDDVPPIGSRVRVTASKLGEGWHVGMLNKTRVPYPCYRILIFGLNNTVSHLLAVGDIARMQVSNLYNKGFVRNYDPGRPLYPNEEWIEVSFNALQVADEKCRNKEKD